MKTVYIYNSDDSILWDWVTAIVKEKGELEQIFKKFEYYDYIIFVMFQETGKEIGVALLDPNRGFFVDMNQERLKP